MRKKPNTKQKIINALEDKYTITHETPTVDSQHIIYYVELEINGKYVDVYYSKGFTNSRDIITDESVDIQDTADNLSEKEKEAIEEYVKNKIDWSEAE